MNDIDPRLHVPDEHIDSVREFLAGRIPDPMHLRVVILDDRPIMAGRCPGCGGWAELDSDQLEGKVSTHHDEPQCGYHKTKNWWADHSIQMGRPV